MKYLRRAMPISIVLLLAMLVAACGGTTGSNGGSTPTPAATTPAPVATTPATAASTVMTATATVGGKSVTILTDTKGDTLYYFKPDTPTTSACTGGCATAWPPLVATGTPTSASTLPGALTAVTTANGNQVEYNGHLLYTYSGDTAPGQTTGEGKGGKWFVCTPDLAAASSASSAIIKTASATVQGKSVTILTDTKGDTLYYYKPDSATTSACTGGCATAWPPLLMTGSGTPSAASTLPGALTAVTTANGNQVEYNGHPLYTYSGDTAPGQTTGEGAGGNWFVVTTDLK